MNTPTTTLRNLIATALVSALAFGFAASSTAADAKQIIVKYGDLAISTPQGAASVYSRLRVAAQKVCTPALSHDLGSIARTDACVQKAIRDAVTQIDQPALSAVYAAKTREQPANLLVANLKR